MLNQSILTTDNLILRLKDKILSEIIQNLFNLYLGRTLGVIDSCISDPEQRKAIVKLIKDAFYGDELWTNELAEILWQFDKASKLHLINNDKLYRELFSLPSNLAEIKDRETSPKASKYFN